MTALHDRIFASVFPPPSDIEAPTPAATPVLGSSTFGEPFGSPNPPQAGFESSAAEQIKWDRAWHTATTYLSLPNETINTQQDENVLRGKWIKPCQSQTQYALRYIVSEESQRYQLRKTQDDLLRWYFEEVVLRHYMQYVLPGLVKVQHELMRSAILFLIFSRC